MKPLTDAQKRAAAQAFLKWAVVKAVELQKQKQGKWRIRKSRSGWSWLVYKPNEAKHCASFESWETAMAAVTKRGA